MRTWVRALRPERCGSCPQVIATGQPMLELRIGLARRVRCEACGTKLFDEPPPADLPTTHLVVPQPSLPLDLARGADMVSMRTVTNHVMADFRRRQAGECE